MQPPRPARSPQPQKKKSASSWVPTVPTPPQIKLDKESRVSRSVRACRLAPADSNPLVSDSIAGSVQRTATIFHVSRSVRACRLATADSNPLVIDGIAGSVQRTATIFQTLTTHLMPTKQDIEATVDTYNVETRRLSRQLNQVERALKSPRCSRSSVDLSASRQAFLASPRRAHRLSAADVSRYGVPDYPKDERKRRNSPYRCDVSGLGVGGGGGGDGGGGGGEGEGGGRAESPLLVSTEVSATEDSGSDMELVVPNLRASAPSPRRPSPAAPPRRQPACCAIL